MKTAIIQPRRHQQGGTLVVTLIATLVVGIVLVSYMSMVSSANRDAVRSETWNAALAVAEAGLEEALAHLQVNYPSNLLITAWTLDGTNISYTRPLGDNYYNVKVSVATEPVVVSTGYARMPGETNYLARTVQIVTLQTGVVTKAFATRLGIKLNGNNISSDSYDSTNPLYSAPDGSYDPEKARDNGDIATNLAIEDAFDAGNANIRGRISTGPDGTVELGPGAVVGDDAWHDAGNVGAQDGYVTDDSNVVMPIVRLPDMSGAFPLPHGGTVGGTNYNAIFDDGKYVVSQLTGKILVTGDATILVMNNLNITDQNFIRISPDASLKLYCAAPTASIGGQGVINDSSQAANFIYYGLPTNRRLAVSGESQFSGVIYAPDTDLQLNGTGEFYGAVLAKTATMNGEFNFHYDESLARTVDIRHIKILSWNEI